MQAHTPFLQFTFTTSYYRPHLTLSPQAIFHNQVFLITALRLPRTGDAPTLLLRSEARLPHYRELARARHAHHPVCTTLLQDPHALGCHLAEQKVQTAHYEEKVAA